MPIHKVYALIYEEKVQNIIVCDDFEMSNYLARAVYGEGAYAIDCYYIPCSIGDIFKDGILYKTLEDGTIKEYKYNPAPTTTETQVQELSSTVDFLTMMVGADTYVSQDSETEEA